MSSAYKQFKLFKYGDNGSDLLKFSHSVSTVKNSSIATYDYFCCKCRDYVVPTPTKLINVPISASSAVMSKVVPTMGLQCPTCGTMYDTDPKTTSSNKCINISNPGTFSIVEYAGIEYVVDDANQAKKIEYIYISREYMIKDSKLRTKSIVNKCIADKDQRQLYYTTETPGRGKTVNRRFYNVCPVTFRTMPCHKDITQSFCNAIFSKFFGLTAPDLRPYQRQNSGMSSNYINFFVYFAIRYPMMLHMIDHCLKGSNFLAASKDVYTCMHRVLMTMWTFASENKDINKLFLCTDWSEYLAIITEYASYYDNHRLALHCAMVDPMYAALMIQMHYLGFKKERSVGEVFNEYGRYLITGKSKIHLGPFIAKRTHALKRFHKSFIKVFGERDWIDNQYFMLKHVAAYNFIDTAAVKVFVNIAVNKYPQKQDFIDMLRKETISDAIDKIN